MQQAQVAQHLRAMADMAGVDICALVDAETGMAWHVAGSLPQQDVLVEAATDYWRMYMRSQSVPKPYGELRAHIMLHACGRMTVAPCGDGTVLVCFSRDAQQIDWSAWMQQARELQSQLTQARSHDT